MEVWLEGNSQLMPAYHLKGRDDWLHDEARQPCLLRMLRIRTPQSTFFGETLYCRLARREARKPEPKLARRCLVGEKHWVDKDHYRVVSGDGTRSWLYKADGGMLGWDTCVEVATHSGDTTRAYEYDGSLIGELLHGNRGKPK